MKELMQIIPHAGAMVSGASGMMGTIGQTIAACADAEARVKIAGQQTEQVRISCEAQLIAHMETQRTKRAELALRHDLIQAALRCEDPVERTRLLMTIASDMTQPR